MRQPPEKTAEEAGVTHAIRSDLAVAEAAEGKAALVAALDVAHAAEGALVLDLDAPRPGQVALQLLVAGREAGRLAGLDVTLGAEAAAALAMVRSGAKTEETTA
ncbi:MAG: hypothetical protein V2I65_11740 [Paracoccaceae bacterium]|jgi:hypothetical protein|nr:hypothetical protein [Paracoccaceae bacterium]